MVHIVLIGHALYAVPPATAHVGNVGGPIVAGGPHDVVDRLLLVGVGSGRDIMLHGETGLRTVY